jgi:trehalose/maltose transport system substrate-binding protein
VQLQRAVRAGYLPTIPRLYQNPDLLQVLPIAAALQNAGERTWIARPSTVAGRQYAVVSKAYYQAVHDILSRRSDAGEALSELEKTLVRLTGFRTGAPRN